MDPPRIIFIDSTKPWGEGTAGKVVLPTPLPTGADCLHTTWRVFPAHLHPQISLLSSPNLQPTDLCWRNGGQCWKAGMLVTQFAVHVELQARAGSGGTSESQESCVCAAISQASLL